MIEQKHYSSRDLLRGLPTGYITALERRLTETEAALFSTIPSQRCLYSNVLQVAQQIGDINDNTTRNAKIDSWKRLPLSSERELDLWRSEISERVQSHGGNLRFHQEPWDEPVSNADDGLSEPARRFSHPGRRITEYQSTIPRVALPKDSTHGLSAPPVDALSKIAPVDRRKYF